MLGENIKKYRDNMGKTQEDIAKFLGVAPQTIYKYEKNINEPDTTTLSKLADYFEITVDELLGRKGEIMDINKEIGIRIKKLREDKAEYQKETADLITKSGTSLSESQLGLYELGLRKVPNNIVIAIAKHFNVTTDYILTGNTINEPIEIAASMKDKADLSEMSNKDKAYILDLIKRLKNDNKNT